MAAVPARTASDPAATLQAMRSALGGDAVLDAIGAFTQSGSWMRDIGPVRADASVEIFYEQPDKFVRRSVRTMGGGGPLPMWTMTTRQGVSGNQAIHEITAPGAPFPVMLPPAGPPPTAAARAAADERRVRDQRVEMARHLLPLLGRVPAGLPLTLTAIPSRTIETSVADGIEIRDGAEVLFTLYVDAQTRRPVLVTWMAKPIVTMSTSSTMTVRGRGEPVAMPPPPPPLPAGDPTAGLPLIPHEMTLADFRARDGVTWPTRYVVRAGGKVIEELRLGRVRLNPKIDPRVFQIPSGDAPGSDRQR